VAGPETLGQVLRRLREAKGLTQAELGALVGVDQATVARWEAGARPRLRHRLPLAEALRSDTPTTSQENPAP
jgi:transcriptional regulator with XRE-family HTH domain